MESMSEPNDELGPDPDATTKVPRDALSAVRRGGASFSHVLFRGYEPLTDEDPVRVDEFWLDARLVATPAGVAYAAHEDHADEVMLLLLNQGAADVRYRDGHEKPSVDDVLPEAPWAALAFDGTQKAVDEARRVLHAVDLQAAPPISKPSGPQYRLHWIDDTKSGRTHLWPLSWPARKDRAGWITLFTSWLLMLLVAALGLLLAILVFQNAPLVSPPAPIPSQGSEGSGSPQSGSPQSGSPQDGSQSGSPQSDHTHKPTMATPSGSESDGGGEPTVNRRL